MGGGSPNLLMVFAAVAGCLVVTAVFALVVVGLGKDAVRRQGLAIRRLNDWAARSRLTILRRSVYGYLPLDLIKNNPGFSVTVRDGFGAVRTGWVSCRVPSFLERGMGGVVDVWWDDEAETERGPAAKEPVSPLWDRELDA